MEEINSKKTEEFLTAIKNLADEECKSIDEETDRLRVERLSALQEEAEDRYKSYKMCIRDITYSVRNFIYVLRLYVRQRVRI